MLMVCILFHFITSLLTVCTVPCTEAADGCKTHIGFCIKDGGILAMACEGTVLFPRSGAIDTQEVGK